MYILHECFVELGLLERDGLIERLREWIARDKHRIEGDRGNIRDRGIYRREKEGGLIKDNCCSLCCSAEGEAYAEATHQSAGCARDHAM